MSMVADIHPICVVGQAPKKEEGAFGQIVTVSGALTYGPPQTHQVGKRATSPMMFAVNFTVPENWPKTSVESAIRSVSSGYATATYLSRVTGLSYGQVLRTLSEDKTFAKSYIIGPDGEDVYRLRSAKSKLADFWAAFRDLNARLSG